MTLDEFVQEYIEEIRNDSIIEGLIPGSLFLNRMVDRLQQMEYIFDPTPLSFYKAGTNGRIMKFDLYAFDEIDKSLILLANDYSDDTSIISLTQTDINQTANRMLNFVEETYNGTVFKYIDPSQDAYKFAQQIKERLFIDYVKLADDQSIDKIKLFIITNKKISNRVSNLKLEDFMNKQVELNVWDIERIYDIVNSGKEKESIIIDINKFNGGIGIQYLKADFGYNEDYDAYLCIIPGKLLSDIYYEHGSRLLEGNVRAFLSVRGKINKGIRNTILREPSKFFTYNNGIACTAKNIEVSNDGTFITKIEDLQIINGGQTTASLTSASKKDGATLANIFIPMKLTVIKSDEYDDMIQNISRYANSQNRVTDADLFSNHPFHRKFEEMSFKYAAPPKQGETNSTYWFYERSRGKYEQSQFKISKKTEKDKFLRKYPKKQLLKKEELAKYLMAGEYMRPDIVSRGSAKNMIEFAKLVDSKWKKNENDFNEAYYNIAVCHAIIFKTVDIIVNKSDWYNVGGYKLNIVPYTISKIFSAIPEGKSVDFLKIWRNQELYKSFIDEIKLVSKIADEFIRDSGGVIVTEYAKREETWKKFKDLPYELSSQFKKDLVANHLIDSHFVGAKSEEKLLDKVNIEIEIFNLAMQENGNYWDRLLVEGIKRKMINPTESSIIKNYICELSKAAPKRYPSQKQLKIAWDIRKRLEADGVIV